MTKKEMWGFLKWLSNTFENSFTFPEESKEKSEDKLLTWMSWLRNYKVEELIIATKSAVKKEQNFAPTPPKIEAEIEENNSLSPEEAWEKARALCVEFHPRINQNPLKGEDVPISIKKTIGAVGGVQAIADRNPEDTYLPNQFMKRYTEIRKTQRREQTFQEVSGEEEKNEEIPEDIEKNREALEGLVNNLAESKKLSKD